MIHLKTKLTALLITGLFFSIYGQDCPEGDLIFYSQDQVDQFIIDYPDCNKVNGNLCVGSCDLSYGPPTSDIVDLSPLTNLIEVKDSIVINKNKFLTTLNGLNNLSIFQGRIYISKNDSLQDIMAIKEIVPNSNEFTLFLNPRIENVDIFQGLDTINFNISITACHEISSLDGFQDTEVINGKLQLTALSKIKNFFGLQSLKKVVEFHIGALDSIENLEGLNQLEIVTDYLFIINNKSLVNLQGLDNLRKTRVLNVSGTNVFNSLTGIENLEEIDADLILQNTRHIENLDALENLQKIGNLIYINNCHSLEDISGLQNVDPNLEPSLDYYNLILTNNPNLSECAIESICGILLNDNLSHDIDDNGFDCNTEEQILAKCIVDVGEENQLSPLTFPNPTDGLIYFKNLKKDTRKFLIINSMGVRAEVSSFEPNQLDMSDFPSGIYTILITENEKIMSFKLMKI